MTSKKASNVKRDKSPNGDNVTPVRQPPPPHHKVINFIPGGSEMCGSIYSQAKRLAKETYIRVTQVGVSSSTLPSLMFDESDKRSIREPWQDGLVISHPMGNCLIKRILVDNGSASNIMMLSTLKQMGLTESDMNKKSTTLVGFSRETSIHRERSRCLRRPWIHNFKVVPSTYHHVLEFPIPWGAQEIRGDQDMTRKCYKTCLKPTFQYHGNKTSVATVTGTEKLAEVDLKMGDKKLLTGEDLSPIIEINLLNFLTTRLDAFAWEHEDIIGIDPNVITHKLNVNPSYTHVQQKRRKFMMERNKIINDKVDKLMKAGIIKEVDYPVWLENVVIVQNKNGKWRFYVDYTDLNKGNILLLGYAFWTTQTGATFQRLVNKMFKDQIGKTIELHIYDIVFKYVNAKNHVRDLWEVFNILGSSNIKFNPSKCNFAALSGKFLGHMVTMRGIEASSEQIKTIFELKIPSNVKDVQKLTGRVAALNRFISRSLDRCKLLYDVLRKNKGFIWSEKYEDELHDLKIYLTTPPLLSKPLQGEDLYVYLSVTDHAISARQRKQRCPVACLLCQQKLSRCGNKVHIS
ncbi:uncharacterized protein LOC141693804 [Apium graveolens]|uniref:uncharacterized protein LOC141693804 n=1 Tax=Apium graveolens TaxID=4045 RepID=UPI003D7A029A